MDDERETTEEEDDWNRRMLESARVVKRTEELRERTPLGEDIKTMLGQIDKILNIYKQLIEIGRPPIITHVDTNHNPAL